MPLAQDILTLRNQTLVELTAAHDYYTETLSAWDIVRRATAQGQPYSYQSLVTGTATTELDLVNRSREYVVRELPEATFSQFISLFEGFFFDLLRLWLLAYPQSLFSRKLDYRVVYDSPDKDAITLLVVNKELNEIMYERPSGWFAYLDSKVKLAGPTADDIERLAEAKATRDLLIHNRGVVNAQYLTKAGRFARGQLGQRLEVPDPYHHAIWVLLSTMVSDLGTGMSTKII